MPLLVPESRGPNPLVRVWCLFHHHLLVATLAAATAHADEPEEAGSDAEGDGEPEDAEHAGAHGGIDVVGFENGLEYAGKGCIDGRCCCGGCESEDSLCLVLC